MPGEGLIGLGAKLAIGSKTAGYLELFYHTVHELHMTEKAYEFISHTVGFFRGHEAHSEKKALTKTKEDQGNFPSDEDSKIKANECLNSLGKGAGHLLEAVNCFDEALGLLKSKEFEKMADKLYLYRSHIRNFNSSLLGIHSSAIRAVYLFSFKGSEGRSLLDQCNKQLDQIDYHIKRIHNKINRKLDAAIEQQEKETQEGLNRGMIQGLLEQVGLCDSEKEKEEKSAIQDFLNGLIGKIDSSSSTTPGQDCSSNIILKSLRNKIPTVKEGSPQSIGKFLTSDTGDKESLAMLRKAPPCFKDNSLESREWRVICSSLYTAHHERVADTAFCDTANEAWCSLIAAIKEKRRTQGLKATPATVKVVSDTQSLKDAYHYVYGQCLAKIVDATFYIEGSNEFMERIKIKRREKTMPFAQKSLLALLTHGAHEKNEEAIACLLSLKNILGHHKVRQTPDKQTGLYGRIASLQEKAHAQKEALLTGSLTRSPNSARTIEMTSFNCLPGQKGGASTPLLGHPADESPTPSLDHLITGERLHTGSFLSSGSEADDMDIDLTLQRYDPEKMIIDACPREAASLNGLLKTVDGIKKDLDRFNSHVNARCDYDLVLINATPRNLSADDAIKRGKKIIILKRGDGDYAMVFARYGDDPENKPTVITSAISRTASPDFIDCLDGIKSEVFRGFFFSNGEQPLTNDLFRTHHALAIDNALYQHVDRWLSENRAIQMEGLSQLKNLVTQIIRSDSESGPTFLLNDRLDEEDPSFLAYLRQVSDRVHAIAVHSIADDESNTRNPLLLLQQLFKKAALDHDTPTEDEKTQRRLVFYYWDVIKHLYFCEGMSAVKQLIQGGCHAYTREHVTPLIDLMLDAQQEPRRLALLLMMVKWGINPLNGADHRAVLHRMNYRAESLDVQEPLTEDFKKGIESGQLVCLQKNRQQTTLWGNPVTPAAWYYKIYFLGTSSETGKLGLREGSLFLQDTQWNDPVTRYNEIENFLINNAGVALFAQHDRGTLSDHPLVKIYHVLLSNLDLIFDEMLHNNDDTLLLLYLTQFIIKFKLNILHFIDQKLDLSTIEDKVFYVMTRVLISRYALQLVLALNVFYKSGDAKALNGALEDLTRQLCPHSGSWGSFLSSLMAAKNQHSLGISSQLQKHVKTFIADLQPVLELSKRFTQYLEQKKKDQAKKEEQQKKEAILIAEAQVANAKADAYKEEKEVIRESQQFTKKAKRIGLDVIGPDDEEFEDILNSLCQQLSRGQAVSEEQHAAVRNFLNTVDLTKIPQQMETWNAAIVVLDKEARAHNKASVQHFLRDAPEAPILFLYARRDHRYEVCQVLKGQDARAIFQRLESCSTPVEASHTPRDGEQFIAPNTQHGLAIPALNFTSIPGDDHCFYHAVALYLGKDQQWARDRVVERLTQGEDRHELIAFLETNHTNPSDYIARIRRNEWAGDVEIQVLMRVLNRPIVVFNPAHQILNANDIQRFRGAPIFVCYNGHNHYDGLLQRDVASRASGAPPVTPYAQSPVGFFGGTIVAHNELNTAPTQEATPLRAASQLG